ncbi:MAG: ABC transporter ATP-binding protein [Culicoidibacterales bacterium]
MKMIVLKRIWLYGKQHPLYIITAIVLSLVQVGFTLLMPIVIAGAMDLIIGPGNVDFDGVLRGIVLLLGMVMMISAATFGIIVSTNILTYKIVNQMRLEAMARVMEMPLQAIDSHAFGDFTSRIVVDIEVIADGLLQGFIQVFTGVIMILGTLAIIFWLNQIIALFVLVITPISLVLTAIIAQKSYNRFKIQGEIRGEMAGYSAEMIGAQTLLKNFSQEEQTIKRYKEMNQKLEKNGVLAQFYSALSNPTTRWVNSIVYTGVGVIGAFLVIDGGMSVGILAAFLIYVNQYMKQFNEMSGVITEIQAAIASAQRVFALIDAPKEIASAKGAVELTSVEGDIRLENISFSYTAGHKIIEGLNLTVKAGQTVAIVGATGCGKTTLINLLMRFYELDSGRILIDGQDMQKFTKTSVRRQFGMVLQQTWLFYGTIAENIAYFKPEATDQEIVRAAKRAHAHHFIEQLAQGYQTKIGSLTGILSEGEKQLIAIARSMLLNSPMLILDEATGSIDSVTEVLVANAFKKMMVGRTSFIIAHRLATIKSADMIVVMEAGKIIEQGNHSTLREKNGAYEKMYLSQFSGNLTVEK